LLPRCVRGTNTYTLDELDRDLSHAGMRFTEPLRPNDPGGLTIRPKT
jgi:hypothetical protein